LSRFLLALGLVLAGPTFVFAVEVEPADLTREPELLGREVTVDDRIKLTLTHDGRVWDEILLMRTPVRFILPSHLRLKSAPDRGQPIRLRGTLRKLNGRQDERGREIYLCDVVERTLMKPDLERLNRAVADLGPKDAKARYEWARWAGRRGADFHDEALLRKADELNDQALRIEAALPSTDQPGHWLALSAKAKGLGRKVEAAALAHLGFRARLTKSAGAAEIERLTREIAETFPDSARPTPSNDLGDWLASYKTDPADAYRRAPAEVRAALDHRLLADALERKWELLALADPKEALTLAAQARERLPDRPEIAQRLEEQGLEALERDVPSLRRDEVETLASLLKKRGEAERAETVTRTWLDDQRTNRLNRRDIEGRIALAELYIEMLGDHREAETLLREAWRIDPGSKTLTRTYRRLGYRRDGDRWISPDESSTTSDPAEPVDGPGRQETKDPLLGLTRGQVRARLGEPERIARSATQGQVVEQWIYRLPKGSQFLNFTRIPGLPQATVQRHGLLP
jgi:hypothetical protein